MSTRFLRALSSMVIDSRPHSLNFLTPLTGSDLAQIRWSLSSPASSPPSLKPKLSTHSLRHAAVIIGLCNIIDQGPGLILTVRSQTLRTHPGEISLPGGHQDSESDQSLLSTAIRETHEEIGLIPDQLEYLGSLAPIINNSGSTMVWPFVVFIHSLEGDTTSSDLTIGPMIPRLMSKMGNVPLLSPPLNDLRGKYQLAEVDLVFQLSFASLLEPERQISCYFRLDSSKPYLEWRIDSEVLLSDKIYPTTNPTRMSSSSTNLKLWGLSSWIIYSFLRQIQII